MIKTVIEIIGIVRYIGLFDSEDSLEKFRHYKVLSYENVTINDIEITPYVKLNDLLYPNTKGDIE